MADTKNVLMLEPKESCTIDDVREVLKDYKQKGMIAGVKINNRVIWNDMPEAQLNRELNIAFSNLSEEEYDSYEKINADIEKLAKNERTLIAMQSNLLHKYYLNTILLFIDREHIDNFDQLIIYLESVFKNETKLDIALRLLSSILLICNNYKNDSDKYLQLNNLFATIPQDENINKEYILDIILIFIEKYAKTTNLPPLLLNDNLEVYQMKLDTEITNYNRMLEKLKKQ